MGPFSQNKSTLDRILWAVIFIGMVANALGGPFSLGSYFLMPVPLIVLNVLVSPINAGILILGATGLFAFSHGLPAAAAFFLLIGVFSQLQGFMIRRNSRVSRILFWGQVFVLWASLLLMATAPATRTLLATLSDNMRQAVLTSDYGEHLTGADLSGFFPFFILYLIFIYTAANFLLSRWILQNRGISVISLGTLSEFQLPQRILEGLLFLGVMGYGTQALGWPGGPALVDTLLYLAVFTLMFQGLAVCSYYLKRQEVPAGWHGVILLALLVLAGPIGLGLTGLVDLLMDLRKQRQTGGNEK